MWFSGHSSPLSVLFEVADVDDEEPAEDDKRTVAVAEKGTPKVEVQKSTHARRKPTRCDELKAGGTV